MFESRLSPEELRVLIGGLAQLETFLTEVLGSAATQGYGDRQQWDREHIRRMMRIIRPRDAVAAARDAAMAMGGQPPAGAQLPLMSLISLLLLLLLLINLVFASPPKDFEAHQRKWQSWLLFDQAQSLEREALNGLRMLVVRTLESLALWTELCQPGGQRAVADDG